MLGQLIATILKTNFWDFQANMIIDGRKIAQKIFDELRLQNMQNHSMPLLCDVVVGDSSVSRQYVEIKERKAKSSGFAFKAVYLPEFSTTSDVAQAVTDVQKLENISGIIVQLPMPAHIDRRVVTEAIDPKYDVDCLTEANARHFYDRVEDAFVFPTALACEEILNSTGVEFLNKNIVIIGEGELVGAPLKSLLLRKGLQVFSINKETENKKEIIKNADVIVSATGAPKSLTADMLKVGAIVVDAGTAESNGSVVGDVDAGSVETRASFFAKVPGGVGPVTVAMLLRNVRKAYISNYGH